MLRGLAFLNVDAKLSHNALHGDAVVVTPAGDWKLFGLTQVVPCPEAAESPPSAMSALVR